MGFFDGAAGGIIGGAISGIGSLFGGVQSAHNAEKLQQMNYQAQKEFAQNGIRWRVADAKAAGIHPLYALGAFPASYSPVSGYSGDNGISEAASQFGQGISRAVQAKMTRDEREREQARQEMQDVFALARFKQDQRYQDAQVRLIDSEIAKNKVASDVMLMNAAKTAPMPGSRTLLSGQADAPPTGTKEAPYWEESIPQFGFTHDPRGRKIDIVPGDDIASRTEDKLIIEWLPWFQAWFRNMKAKTFGSEVDGYWWHGDDKGYLPHPPKPDTSRKEELDRRQRRWNEHFPNPHY